MSDTIQQFGEAARNCLKAEPGPAGLEKVRQLLERDLLTNQDVISAHLANDDAPERNVLYEDQELGFCVVAHNYQGREALHSSRSWTHVGHLRPGCRNDVNDRI